MSKLILSAVVLCLVTGGSVAAEEPMKHVVMNTVIAEGPDQSVEKLHEGEWTRLVQITLRNGATLAKHAAKEAITVQCISGAGVFIAGEERVELKPGTIVVLEPNVVHSVESSPAVSVLVTRFLPASAAEAKEPAHQH